MNNVLGGILGIAEMLRDDLPEQYREDLDGVIESTKRGAELTRNLVGFARRGKYRKERVVQSCLEDGALGFVDKPYSVESLTGAVAQALRKTAPRGMSQRVRIPRASSSMPS